MTIEATRPSVDGIVFDKVTKHFGTGRARIAALGEISLTVGRGEFVTVIGP